MPASPIRGGRLCAPCGPLHRCGNRQIEVLKIEVLGSRKGANHKARSGNPKRRRFLSYMKTALSGETVHQERPLPPETSDSDDPYRLRPEDVAEPPQSIPGILRKTGPGIILAASIVGSGELIATTTLGAQVGYTALWIILLSCLIKPVVQAELGRYTIASGETGLEGLNRVPGPRWRVNWIVMGWSLMLLVTLLQVGAMFGGIGQVMNQLVPAVSSNLWVLVILIITLVLLLGGGYRRIESLATIKVVLFT